MPSSIAPSEKTSPYCRRRLGKLSLESVKSLVGPLCDSLVFSMFRQRIRLFKMYHSSSFGTVAFMRSALFAFVLLLCATSQAAEIDVWIGTGEPGGTDPGGIYHLVLDDETGKLSPASLVAERTEAGFLAMHPTLPVLYSTGGGVSSWRVSRENTRPQLELLNETTTGDGRACHVSVDQTGRVLFSAQYAGGSVTSYPLADDGSIGDLATKIEHDEPSNVVAGRQKACHPHWAGVSPDNRFVIIPDLGADRIFVHRLDVNSGKLSKFESVNTPAGGGPRHFKFHPSLSVGYVVNELAMSLSVLNYDASQGKFELLQTVPALSKPQITGEKFNSGSEVRVHPSGKFVYSGNRGHDSISVFAVDQSTGELTLVEQESIRGSWPRNFNLDPSGRWLLAAGARSNTLAVFSIDQKTGALQYAMETQQVPAPICVLIEPSVAAKPLR